jgi:hypothetical protein
MATMNFWDSFVPTEVKEARFGLIPDGRNNVQIIDVAAMRASQTFKLDDSGKIIGITAKIPKPGKAPFDMRFDQDILAIVFMDTEGRVLIDRRSSKGWVSADETWKVEVDRNGVHHVIGTDKVTTEMKQRHGLIQVGKYFVSSTGVPIPSDDKTASCADFASRLFNACGTTKVSGLIGSDIIIDIKTKTFGGESRPEVVGYYPLDHKFKDASEGTTNTTTTAPAAPKAPVAPVIPEQAEELVF